MQISAIQSARLMLSSRRKKTTGRGHQGPNSRGAADRVACRGQGSAQWIAGSVPLANSDAGLHVGHAACVV